MTSMFDPQQFLDVTLTEPTVKRPPIPIGDYLGSIKSVKARAWKSRDNTKSGIAVDVAIEVALGDLAQSYGAPAVVISDSIMLDTLENGSLDNSVGKNRKLGNYRDALDMNKKGEQFSIRMMEGRMIRVKVSHEMYEGDIYDRIEKVAKV